MNIPTAAVNIWQAVEALFGTCLHRTRKSRSGHKLKLPDQTVNWSDRRTRRLRYGRFTAEL